MFSINEISNRELQKMDIHELRILARQVGVSSPTTRKKSELIDSIVSIITGKSVPELKNINRGRPAKNAATQYDFVEQQYKDKLNFSEFDPFDIAASPVDSYGINKKNNVINGVVTKQGDKTLLKKFKFAETLDDMEISQDLVNLYNLKENDVVTYVNNKENMQVLTINGQAVVPTGSLDAVNKTIKLAASNILFIDGVEQKKELLGKLKQFAKVIYLPANPASMLSDQNIVSVPMCQTNEKELFNSFCSACDVAQFYKNSCGAVVLVADNFLSVISAVYQFGENSLQVQNELFANISKLLQKGITFVGIIPSALNNLFANLSKSFDNIQ